MIHEYVEQQLFDPELHTVLKGTQVGDLVVGFLMGVPKVGVLKCIGVVGAGVMGFLMGDPEVGVLEGVVVGAFVGADGADEISHKLVPFSVIRTFAKAGELSKSMLSTVTATVFSPTAPVHTPSMLNLATNSKSAKPVPSPACWVTMTWFVPSWVSEFIPI